MNAKLLSAVHLILLDRENVLLLKRVNTGYEDGNYSLVAGHLDGGETIKAAMIRETKEETGITLTEDALNIVGVMHRDFSDERIDFFLTAERWEGEINNCELHRCDELRWFSVDYLPDNIIPYIRKAIQNYREGVWFDESFLYTREGD
ncbi:MAG: NUDIX domain-containing protein [Anaerolineales bacterium]|nr:NUDIX domain-containing protein [Anaerolineales bacterium]